MHASVHAGMVGDVNDGSCTTIVIMIMGGKGIIMSSLPRFYDTEYHDRNFWNYYSHSFILIFALLIPIFVKIFIFCSVEMHSWQTLIR